MHGRRQDSSLDVNSADGALGLMPALPDARFVQGVRRASLRRRPSVPFPPCFFVKIWLFTVEISKIVSYISHRATDCSSPDCSPTGGLICFIAASVHLVDRLIS